MQSLISRVIVLVFVTQAFAVDISIQPTVGQLPISPALFGRNGSISDDPKTPTPDSLISLYKDVGTRILRLNDGNNNTKYNWRKKLSSHPDWYNNVYAHDWDFKAQELANKLPGVMGFFGLQALGWAARTDSANFDANGYNNSKWWPGTAQNLAGGGVVNASGGSKATTEGDPSKYLMPWPADSSTEILTHWFGTGGLGFDKSSLRYWNVDNEPDIWNGTHDDVVKSPMSIDTFITKYVQVALKARAKFPEVILAGPVFSNDWYWWNWNNGGISENGTLYSPMEYFIKKIGEQEVATGKRLLDVFDLHMYPEYSSMSKEDEMLQFHRIFFDTAYAWPSSNGINTYVGKWQQPYPQFTYLRVQRWMNKYLGAGRARLGMSEFGAITLGDTTADGCADPSACAVLYGSMMGTFADHGVELFTPWTWAKGMNEALNIFSHYSKTVRVQTTSTLDSAVSAYASVNATGDSLNVILINRSKVSQTSTVNTGAFVPKETSAQTFQVSSLVGETFKSKTSNALQAGTVAVTSGNFTLSLPALSITAVVLSTTKPITVGTLTHVSENENPLNIHVSGNLLQLILNGSVAPQSATLYDLRGHAVFNWSLDGLHTNYDLDISALPTGQYVVSLPSVGSARIVKIESAR